MSNFKNILQQIEKKQFQSIYLLHGEETFYIDKITAALEENVLNEAEKSFNLSILYGKEVDFKTVMDTARRYPMMSQYQLVIVKEAQEMKTLAEMLTYIENPLESTVLVFAHKHKKLDMRTKFAKALQQKALVFESNKLYDNQIPEWIQNYLGGLHLTIKSDTAALIAEYLGADLSKIANELDKLALNVAPKTQITPEIIEENIGISKDYNVFEFQKALGQKDVLKANRIVLNFAENPRRNPLVVVIGTLYNFFSKVYMLQFIKTASDNEQTKTLQLRSDWALKEYKEALRHYNLPKTQQIIQTLKEYDLKSKGVGADNADEGELLKELTWKILH